MELKFWSDKNLRKFSQSEQLEGGSGNTLKIRTQKEKKKDSKVLDPTWLAWEAKFKKEKEEEEEEDQEWILIMEIGFLKRA